MNMKNKKLTGSVILVSMALSSCLMVSYAALTDAQAQESLETQESITLKNGEWDDVFFNEEYKNECMYTVKNEEVSIDNTGILLSKKAGFGLVIPEAWRDNTVALSFFSSDNYLEIYVFRPDGLAKMQEIEEGNENDTATEYEGDADYIAVDEDVFRICAIYSQNVADQGDNTLFPDSTFGANYSCAEKIGTFGELEYYFAYNDTPPEESFTDDETATIRNILDSMDKIRDNVILFPSYDSFAEIDKELQETLTAMDLSSFGTLDLNENTVTQDIFKDYDITMIDIWTTWCESCRNKLPEIQAAYEQLPENANIISICQDTVEESDLANAIVEKTGLKYPILVSNDELAESLFTFVTAYPTTIFVDSVGHPAATAVMGVPTGDDVTHAYLDYINDALAK